MNATTFPISMPLHIGFVIIAVIFFVIQFYRQRRIRQVLLTIAVLASLLIYIDTSNRSLFSAVGWFEVIIIVAAIVLSIVQTRLDKRREKEEIVENAIKNVTPISPTPESDAQSPDNAPHTEETTS